MIQQNKQKYVNIWTQEKTHIITMLSLGDKYVQDIQMNAEKFQKVGNRKKYSFNLEFKDGHVYNNIAGTAVARDLARVLQDDREVMKILTKGHYKLSMGSDFVLKIKKISG